MTTAQYSFIVNVSTTITKYFPCLSRVGDWIGCQFALESNFGISNLAKDNNNYCGMRNPLVRISSARHVGDPLYNWAIYDNLNDCIIDYILCIQYHKPLSVDYDTIEHFSRFIMKFYCPERDYIDKINKIYSQFNSYQNGKEK